MVFFGLQAFIKEYLITYFKRDFFKLSTDEVQELYTISMDIQLGEGNYDISPILKLHELGLFRFRSCITGRYISAYGSAMH